MQLTACCRPSVTVELNAIFRDFLTSEKAGRTGGPCNKILIIQCDFDEASHSTNLIASAK